MFCLRLTVASSGLVPDQRGAHERPRLVDSLFSEPLLMMTIYNMTFEGVISALVRTDPHFTESISCEQKVTKIVRKIFLTEVCDLPSERGGPNGGTGEAPRGLLPGWKGESMLSKGDPCCASRVTYPWPPTRPQLPALSDVLILKRVRLRACRQSLRRFLPSNFKSLH